MPLSLKSQAKTYFRFFVIILCTCNPMTLVSQSIFQGSFLMSFTSSNVTIQDYPLQWTIQPISGGIRMAMEIEDNMRMKGVDKRVLFNPADSTWMMLMAIGNVKQGTKIHRAMMYRDSTLDQKEILKFTKISRIISNLKCYKTIRETDTYITEYWITMEYTFNVCKVYKLLSHCGMMSESIRKGDWFNWKNPKGMIVEITTKNKLSGDFYTVALSQIKFNAINLQLFNLAGYKISEIPEGQNCGPVVKEK